MHRRRMGIILAIVFLDLLSFGIIIPQLGVYAKHYGASAAVQGLLVGSYALMQFLAAPLLGRWSDRVGRRPVLLVALVTTFCGHVLFAFARSLPLLFLSRLVDGLGGANVSTAQAYLSDITPPEKRARAMGLVGAAFGIGFVLGPVLGGLAGSWGTRAWGTHGGNLAIGGTAALLSLVTLALTTFLLPESLPPEERPEAPGRMKVLDVQGLRDAVGLPVVGRLLAIFLIGTAGFAVLHAILTYFVIDVLVLDMTTPEGVASAQQAAMKVFGWIGILAVLVQGGGIRPLAARFGETKLLRAGLVLTTIGLIALPTAPSMALLLLFATPLAVGNALNSATLPALITFHSPPQRRGEILGVSHSLGSVGRIIGPLAGGALYDFGQTIPFWAGAVLTAFAFVLALGVPLGRPDDAAREKASEEGDGAQPELPVPPVGAG